jgi:ribosomal protein S18 acetylase RimI-like enzyme
MGQPVGFGSFDLCDDYKLFTDGKIHPYIPLIAVNPTIKSLGYGTSIANYLIAEAALVAREVRTCCDVLFLDVYVSNRKAIALYKRVGFEVLTDTPLDDAIESSQYWVMGRRMLAP